jgi:hypothetical protein
MARLRGEVKITEIICDEKWASQSGHQSNGELREMTGEACEQRETWKSPRSCRTKQVRVFILL